MCHLIFPKVIAADRRKGHLAFLLVLLGFFAASVIALYQAYERRSSPPSQIELIRETFPWPYVTFCPDDDVFEAEWLVDQATCNTRPGEQGDDEDYSCQAVLSAPEPARFCEDDPDNCLKAGHCATFQTGTRSAEQLALNREAELEVYLPFNADFFAEAASTHLGRSHVLDMYVHSSESLYESAAGTLRSAQVAFPSETFVNLQPSRRVKISGSEIYSYQLSITAAPLPDFEGNSTVGNFAIVVKFAPNDGEVTVVTEQDPLDLLLMAGIISGFWGIALGVYGVLFKPSEDTPLMASWRRAPPADDEDGLELEKSVPAAATSSSSGTNLA